MRNQPEVNISTIEDPVEYKIPGINHIQVNQATGLTFAKGLRALLRQDPDVILVGEIRDGETASIAVSAALTGHLVFSTLHSNDSATAIPRMLEMGVEPFLLASTVEVVIAQRLVRRICPRCRFAYELKGAEVQELFREALTYFPKAGKTTFFRGRGCDACSNTGFVGRIGIYELLVVDKVLEELITQRRNSSELLNSARKRGMKLMFDDGIDKVRAGQTTIEELLRVAAPPDTVLTSLH
jgi:type II secretory ATPase GspE/PulE/Tfp pilus assembly ATPase PilB-like protein